MKSDFKIWTGAFNTKIGETNFSDPNVPDDRSNTQLEYENIRLQQPVEAVTLKELSEQCKTASERNARIKYIADVVRYAQNIISLLIMIVKDLKEIPFSDYYFQKPDIETIKKLISLAVKINTAMVPITESVYISKFDHSTYGDPYFLLDFAYKNIFTRLKDRINFLPIYMDPQQVTLLQGMKLGINESEVIRERDYECNRNLFINADKEFYEAFHTFISTTRYRLFNEISSLMTPENFYSNKALRCLFVVDFETFSFFPAMFNGVEKDRILKSEDRTSDERIAMLERIFENLRLLNVEASAILNQKDPDMETYSDFISECCENLGLTKLKEIIYSHPEIIEQLYFFDIYEFTKKVKRNASLFIDCYPKMKVKYLRAYFEYWCEKDKIRVPNGDIGKLFHKNGTEIGINSLKNAGKIDSDDPVYKTIERIRDGQDHIIS